MIIGEGQTAGQIARALDQWVKQMKCSGDTGLGIESFKDIRVGVDDSDVDNDCESYDPITDNDRKGLEMQALDGYFSLQLDNGDTVEGFFKYGLRHGACKIVSRRTCVEEISGEYREGRLEGKAKIKKREENVYNGEENCNFVFFRPFFHK